MSLVIIDKKEIPCPSEYTAILQDITNAERNAKGTMFIDLIAKKWKIELGWKYLSKEELGAIMATLESKIQFEVTFVAPTGETLTKSFYKGDRKAPMKTFFREIPSWSFNVNLIEV